jgi:hypothetical protein
MKRIFSILFNTLAVVTLLMSVVVPHHHHGDMICIGANHCGHEHKCDNCKHDDRKCSSHCLPCHNNNDNRTHGVNCLAKISYVVSHSREMKHKIRPDEGHNNPNNTVLFVPIFIGLINCYSSSAKYVYLTKRRHRERIFFRELDNVNRNNGLRAPPYSAA